MAPAEAYQLARAGAAVIDLSGHAKLELTGEDRVRFLNGQVSNDVRSLSPDSPSMPACVMTAKGKMAALVQVVALPDRLRLNAAPGTAEALAARLERYVISDDVELHDVSAAFGMFHLLGTPQLPAEWDVRQAERFGAPGIDITFPAQTRADVLAALGLPMVPAEASETLRIEAGQPAWGRELTEATIPVEAGLQRNAIDYHKGCYVGQEVISRLKSIGHVNRHLRGFVALGDAQLEAGAQLFVPGGETLAGSLTSVAMSFALEKPVALGYLKRGVTADRLDVRTSAGTLGQVAVKDLPLIP